jgi:hypothetical protein
VKDMAVVVVEPDDLAGGLGLSKLGGVGGAGIGAAADGCMHQRSQRKRRIQAIGRLGDWILECCKATFQIDFSSG